MKVKQTKYDPSKSYRWNPDDEFTMSGEDFSVFYHAFNRAINSTGGLTPMETVKCQSILQGLFLLGVEQNIIKEEEKQTQNEEITRSADDRSHESYA